MMTSLAKRGEALAQAAQQRAVKRLADALKARIGSAAVTVEDARILLSGRSLMKRWLTDPALRFIAGDLK